MPTVSVIIPTYNRGHYLCNAVDSVLAQTYQDFEIIVVDDGSSDKTAAIIKNYHPKVRYVYKDNGGLSSARNVGIREAEGKYMAFLDDDDSWLPDNLEIKVNFLENNPEYGFIVSNGYFVDHQENVIREINRRDIGEENIRGLIRFMFISVLNVLVRKECVDQTGDFDETLDTVEDYDYWLRLVKHARMKYLDMPLGKVRKHDLNMSKNILQIAKDELKVFQKNNIQKYISIWESFFIYARLYYRVGVASYKKQLYKQALSNLFNAATVPLLILLA